MKVTTATCVALLFLSSTSHAFAPYQSTASKTTNTALYSTIGLGPSKEKEGEKEELIPGVDYQVPNHEEFRTSRRNKLDEQCDNWFRNLVGTETGVLGSVAQDVKTILSTPVELQNQMPKTIGNDDYTPYVSTRLPWTPLLPAFGLEEFGLPIPRRNAEAWRHFDVPGMVAQDYSLEPADKGTDMSLSDEQVASYQQNLQKKGGWLNDDACNARLVYINGRFVPQLSKTTDNVHNMNPATDLKECKAMLSRLTDGFTDQLASPVPSGDDGETLTSYKALSKPNHNVGEPTSQFAINGQQGTACFAALNTIKTGAVAYIRHKAGTDSGDEETPKPVLLINAVTSDCGVGNAEVDSTMGVACHPRALVVAENGSRLAFVQSMVDLDADAVEHRPKLYNGYTQIFVEGNANVTHSYLEETGGIVTGGTEVSDEDLEEGVTPPREIESQRPALKDTHLEAIDAHCTGEDGSFQSTIMAMGGSGRVRVCLGVSLLKPGTHASVNGFCLSGGAQRCGTKTNIHHVAQGTTSNQIQKTMVGGRATGSFRGRIRVEQSAQQTDSDQISRTVLLSDRCRAWAVPSLEIIADDVKCTHGATVSDLSEEELFYMRSRGLDQALARNLLMFAFAGDISDNVDPSMLGSVDSSYGIQKRVIQRLENLVPRGERAVKGEFQSV